MKRNDITRIDLIIVVFWRITVFPARNECIIFARLTSLGRDDYRYKTIRRHRH